MKQTTKPATPRLVVLCYICGGEKPWGEPCPACPQPYPEPTLPGIAMAVLIGLSVGVGVGGVGVGLVWGFLWLVGR